MTVTVTVTVTRGRGRGRGRSRSQNLSGAGAGNFKNYYRVMVTNRCRVLFFMTFLNFFPHETRESVSEIGKFKALEITSTPDIY